VAELRIPKADHRFTMRLFIALDIDDAIREKIRVFLEGVRGFAPDARWVRSESLHVTLKFIGEKPADTADAIKRALAKVEASPIELSFRGHGFFPTPKSARVFWIGIQSGPDLPKLASVIDDASATLDIPKEDRGFSPHLTLARRGGGSGSPRWRKGDVPNKAFERLSGKLAAMSPLDFGTMTAREFFLYQSQLSREGSRYTKLEAFPLRGSGSPVPDSHKP
jgi:RNA 2',3'-cyclic 3'-phosphodiesterase